MIELWREDIYCNRYLIRSYEESEREQAEEDLRRFVEKGHHQIYELIERPHDSA
jgi:hypothetical protein